MGIPDNPRIREQKQKYLRNKSYLHDVTLRAEPYMYWIAGQVKKRNMPMELVLLPIVESAFDPHATSAPMPQAFGRSFRAQGAIMV
ncbi:Membrane-bound lytic murein transglycosylase D [Klebsiella pneumoniae]|nr:Membrane-bound lytic murein transglycosylase D [Klebsiella pneumoniae]